MALSLVNGRIGKDITQGALADNFCSFLELTILPTCWESGEFMSSDVHAQCANKPSVKKVFHLSSLDGAGYTQFAISQACRPLKSLDFLQAQQGQAHGVGGWLSSSAKLRRMPGNAHPALFSIRDLTPPARCAAPHAASCPSALRQQDLEELPAEARASSWKSSGGLRRAKHASDGITLSPSARL